MYSFGEKGRNSAKQKYIDQIHRYTSILRPGNGSQCEHPSGVCAKVLQQFLIRPPCFDVRWNNVPSFWHSSIVGIQEGSAFCRSSKCGFTGPIKKVAEWNICWRPVARDISAGWCIVYSFGIAKDDPFSNFLWLPQVVKCIHLTPRNNIHANVTIYQYWLISGIGDEHSYNHADCTVNL